MAFSHQKNDPENANKNDPQTQMRISLEGALRKSIEKQKLSFVEVSRKSGRGGYAKTGLEWHIVPGDEDPDDAGSMAAEILDEVRVHAEENGGPEYYNVCGYRDDGAKPVEVLKVTMSKASFASLQPMSRPDDRSSELLAGFAQMRTQNADLHRLVLKMAEAPIKVIEQCATFVEKAAKTLEAGGNQEDHSFNTMTKLLEYLENQRNEEFSYRRQQDNKDRNAAMFREAIKTFGPELTDTLRELFARMGAKMPGDDDDDATDAEASTPDDAEAERKQKRELRYRDRLRSQIDNLEVAVQAQLKELLGEDRWSVLDASANAGDHDEFTTLVAKLKTMIKDEGDEAARAMMMKVAGLVPPESAMLFKNLLSM